MLSLNNKNTKPPTPHSLENLIKKNLDWQEAIIEGSRDAILLSNLKGQIIVANFAASELTGFSREELLDMSMSDLYENADCEAKKDAVMAGNATLACVKVMRKDGGIIYAEFNNRRISIDGKPCIHTVARDISERRRAELALRQALDEIQRLKNRLQEENIYLQQEIKLTHNFEEIVSKSKIFRSVLTKIEQVAPTDTTVLILGETGTGKELLARAVHSHSKRSGRPLVKINCAALPANLIESELFGHEKGAFTGALIRKIGRFELADGGAIFLDEIGDLPPELQAKLLRVLQEGEFERLGNPQTIKVDVRIIAATNRDLPKAIENGDFREDLYYRLNVFPIYSPPLRERKEDIPLLVHHFIHKYSAKIGKKIDLIPQKVMESLSAYHWPGNVRELENIIERALIISTGNQLKLGDWLQNAPDQPGHKQLMTLEELQKKHIQEILEMTGWRISGNKGAAKILGLKRTTLESRMKKLGIQRTI